MCKLERTDQTYYLLKENASKFLNENKKHISTNAKKGLVLNGKPIPDCHFPDLLRSLYKRNQSMNFTGLAEFESMFPQVNASQ